ncbi:hypothetical protein [Sporosarcina sp. A2]|uniref:hypothetical protein n=1 Tax=Sporosarcina sp. A2 TaxID=3393449 RepID=UPI003D7B29AC
MQYKTRENNLNDLEVLKTFLSPVEFESQSGLSKEEMDRLLQEQQIKNETFETEEVKIIAEQLAAVIQAIQSPYDEIDYGYLHKKMQSITVLLQKIEADNIEELKYINSLLEQIGKSPNTSKKF